jgi:hypothetical protein
MAKMRSIYEYGENAAVYLGEHTELELSTRCKITSATEWVVGLLNDFQPINMSLNSILSTMADLIHKGSRCGAGVCAVHSDSFEQGVYEMSRLKWLDRVWIKQQIWAACSVEVR